MLPFRSCICVVALAGLPSLAALPASEELGRIIRDFEAYGRAEDPMASGADGDRSALSRLPGIAPADEARRKAALERFRTRLTAVEVPGLTEEEALNLVTLQWEVDVTLEGQAFDSNRLAYSNEGGPETWLTYLGASTTLLSRADAEAYLSRLEGMEKLIAASTENLRRGIRTGFLPSRETTLCALRQMRAVLAAPAAVDGEGAMLPFASMPAMIPPDEQGALRARARALLQERVRPAFEAFVRVVATEALPVAKDALGIASLPNGTAYYTYLARYFTTTRMTPEEIHAFGLQEVQRIRSEMEKEMVQAGFKGSFSSFQAFLRKDPQFYATSREGLMEKAARITKRADAALPKFFGTLPRLSYGVEEVPRSLEENYTTARYMGGSAKLGVAGSLLVNTSHLDQRPLYELPALMLHEGVPGHHLQGAIQLEMNDQPWFRRQLDVTAYVEGWGLYAEFLGTEMGMYTTPYERIGKLSMEAWRACRLVVDTGIHVKGWPLRQAQTFMTENTFLAPRNIENEIQRYVAGPAQALAYKIGETKLRSVRRKAEAELGPRFDLRRFHDAVLWGGPLPLEQLELHMEQWVAKEKARGE